MSDDEDGGNCTFTLSTAVKAGHNDTLIFAVKYGDIEGVKVIIDEGAEIDAKDVLGKTPLHYAVEKKRTSDIKMTDIVKMLLDNGARINAKNRNGETPLHCAIEKKNIIMTELLLRHGAHVNARDNNDLSPLHVAAWEGCLQTVDYLLNYGADISAEDKTRRTPIFYAIWKGDLKTTRLLLTRKPNLKDRPHLLNIASQKGCIEIVQALLENNADINASDSNGLTALHFTASREPDYDIDFDDIKDIFSLKPRQTSYPNAYVSYNTIYKPLSDMVTSFFNHNINAIHMPVIGPEILRREIAKLLLSKGANIDAQDVKGATSLHHAIDNGHKDLVEALLEYNPNVNLVTKNKNGSPFLTSVLKGNVEVITMLLNKGADINAKLECGSTALHIATHRCIASHRCTEYIQLLLSKGANVNAQKKDGTTALHIAVSSRNVELCKMLLNWGANINATQTLSKFGASIHPVDEEGRTALHIACRLSANGEQLERNRLSAIIKLLVLHVLKLKVANMYINKQNNVYYSYCIQRIKSGLTSFRGVKNYFIREIESMKREKIIHNKLSFYDFLVRTPSSLVIYMRNENILQVLKSINYESKFPMYVGLIKNQFSEVMERKELLEQCIDIFYFLFNKATGLPQECSEKIQTYLSNEDIKSLIDAFQPL
ncbi:putative ankyrin repeat protein RF_0381 [Artemia franciscana]|uniref:PRANC domain-containing protein n=1 Tax=Artemia franciscana TaxID=6661 RepID=A0AA88H872_ARTSF|nr:hypothetical protein QYM36_017717 [Artemia franciscana]KAK2703939.1 hypothetical protein QYM36_017717 [Artemia franciscana]